jgi:hypothetical protein
MKPSHTRTPEEFFNNFYFQETYSGYDSRAEYNDSRATQVFKNDLVRAAFYEGMRCQAEQTLRILDDWGYAAEGLDPELLAPGEVFYRAQDNLASFYNQQPGVYYET